MSTKQLIFSLLIIVTFHCISQTNDGQNLYPQIEVQTYGGAILAHRDAMDSIGNKPYFGTEFRLGFQTNGAKHWHALYNYPKFGVGFYSANFNNKIIGKPHAVFLFMELPFSRKEKSFFSTCWGVGGTFNINEFDSVKNPDNVAIGSDVNVFIDFSLLYKYKLNERWEFGTGIKLQHFSNGAYAYPNLGLNMASGAVSIAYTPGKVISSYKTGLKPDEYLDIEVVPMMAFSWRSKGMYENHKRYMNTTTSIAVNKRVNAKRTLGVGIDYFYQEYLIDYYDKGRSVSDKDLMSYAGFLSSDMVVDRFRLAFQLGFYMHRPVDFGLFFYERVALRFYPIKNMFVNVSIKAHAAKAEFVEWGMGFTF